MGQLIFFFNIQEFKICKQLNILISPIVNFDKSVNFCVISCVYNLFFRGHNLSRTGGRDSASRLSEESRMLNNHPSGYRL